MTLEKTLKREERTRGPCPFRVLWVKLGQRIKEKLSYWLSSIRFDITLSRIAFNYLGKWIIFYYLKVTRELFFSFNIYHPRLGKSNPSNVIATILVRKKNVAEDRGQSNK